MATTAKPTAANRTRAASDLSKVLELIKQKNIQVVDVKFTDTSFENDHVFLLEGGVFTPDVISTRIEMKRARDIPAVNLRPHPYEFFLDYDA